MDYLSITNDFIGHEKSQNQFISTNMLKADYFCDLKPWLVDFSPLSFYLCKKLSIKG